MQLTRVYCKVARTVSVVAVQADRGSEVGDWTLFYAWTLEGEQVLVEKLFVPQHKVIRVGVGEGGDSHLVRQAGRQAIELCSGVLFKQQPHMLTRSGHCLCLWMYVAFELFAGDLWKVIRVVGGLFKMTSIFNLH